MSTPQVARRFMCGIGDGQDDGTAETVAVIEHEWVALEAAACLP